MHLARSQFDGLARRCISAARDNLRLGSFIAPDPVERLVCDLETYLRQPNLDGWRDAAAVWLIDHGGVFSDDGMDE